MANANEFLTELKALMIKHDVRDIGYEGDHGGYDSHIIEEKMVIEFTDGTEVDVSSECYIGLEHLKHL